MSADRQADQSLFDNETAAQTDTRPPDPDHPDSRRDSAEGLSFPFSERPAPGTATEVGPGVVWIRMPLPWSLDHINLYAISDGDGWALVDTGIDAQDIRGHWQTVFAGAFDGRPVTRMIVTHHHPDHIGLAGWVASLFDAPILATRNAYLLARVLMLDVADTPPDEVLAFSRRAGFTWDQVDKLRARGWGNFARLVAPLPVGFRRIGGGDVLSIGGADWHVIETAGHAPGHASLYDPAKKLLISGDQILPRISSNVSVYPTEPDGNPLAEWLDGLARMRALPDDTLVLPAHNTPFYGLRVRLDALIGKHVSRLGDVAALCDEPCAAVDIFPALFRQRVTRDNIALATGEAIAHLHWLEAAGVVQRLPEDDGVARFRKVADYDMAGVTARLDMITQQARETAAWPT